MKLLVGIGNPGDKYVGTRHNIGAELLYRYAHKHGGDFSFKAKHNAYMCTIDVAGIKVHCAFPQTYMNLSGESVGSLVRFYDINPDEVLVIHDEIDLPNAKIQLRNGGGHAGHNGLKSIIAHLGTKDFWRLRIGVSRPERKEQVSGYVLGKFLEKQKEAIDAKRQFIDEFTTRWIVGNI